MWTRGQLRIDPGVFDAGPDSGLELVVAYTGPDVTRAVLDRAAAMTQGLNARISLIAVHTVPYPTPFGCPSAGHAFLVDRLVDLCAVSPLPASALVILARSREEGFRQAFRPESIVLLGSERRPWTTPEERLARLLADDGHKVTLIHVG